MDFPILNFQLLKKFEIGPKILPNHPKSTPKPSQIRPNFFENFDFFQHFSKMSELVVVVVVVVVVYRIFTDFLIDF